MTRITANEKTNCHELNIPGIRENLRLKGRGASPIKEVLGTVISSLNGEKRIKTAQLLEAWKGAVDKEAYNHTRLANFRKRRLVVNVDSPAWMYELNLRKQQISDALNKQLKDERVEEIILRIGEVT